MTATQKIITFPFALLAAFVLAIPFWLFRQKGQTFPQWLWYEVF